MGPNDLILLISASSAAAAAGAAILWTIRSRCFVTVPPNRALVLFGRKARRPSIEPGLPPADVDVHRPRIVVGGGVYVAPWNHGVGRLSLDPVSVDVSVRSLYAADGSRASGWEVRLQVRTKVPAEPGSLARAAENLLGKTDAEIQALVARTVEAGVPSVLSRLRREEAEPDWDRLAAEIQASVAADLMAWGFVIQSLSVTELRPIVPAEAPEARFPSKPRALPGVAVEPEPLDPLAGALEARLERAERNLGVLGAAVTGWFREPKAAPDGEYPVSVLDYPLGSEVPASVVWAEAPFASLHESMEGDRAPPFRPEPAERGFGEGGRDGLRSSD